MICYLALVFQKYLEKILRDNNLILSTTEIQRTLRETTFGVKEMKSGDIFIKDKEPENYILMAKIFNISLLPFMGELSKVKKCRCVK